MTRARNQLISPETSSYYHCISRCVRRAFLCGEDFLTGNNYEHRKAWVIERLRELADVFAIDICAYAIMSNHYHLVLRINQDKGSEWTNHQVIEQWEKTLQLVRAGRVLPAGGMHLRRGTYQGRGNHQHLARETL